MAFTVITGDERIRVKLTEDESPAVIVRPMPPAAEVDALVAHEPLPSELRPEDKESEQRILDEAMKEVEAAAALKPLGEQDAWLDAAEKRCREQCQAGATMRRWPLKNTMEFIDFLLTACFIEAEDAGFVDGQGNPVKLTLAILKRQSLGLKQLIIAKAREATSAHKDREVAERKN